MRPNTAKAAPKVGEVPPRRWLACGHPLTTESVALDGLYWLAVDRQHGAMSTCTAQSVPQAVDSTDTTAMVRAAWNDIAMIKYALDAGAYGLVIPMLSPGEGTAEAVQF